MKLRSIALSGLLGAGLLMTSGCSEDIIEDILKANVIYTVNGTVSDVTFTVTGDTDAFVASKEYAPHLLTGHSDYAVSYTPNTGLVPISFPHGSVYMYAAANCTLAASGYLQHEVNANKVNFVNLSETNLPGGTGLIVITQADGTEHTVTEDIGLCSINGAASLNGVVLENDMNISIDGGSTTLYTVTGMDPDLIALGDKLKIDVVLFEDGTMNIVPMVGYDDLLTIGVGAL